MRKWIIFGIVCIGIIGVVAFIDNRVLAVLVSVFVGLASCLRNYLDRRRNRSNVNGAKVDEARREQRKTEEGIGRAEKRVDAAQGRVEGLEAGDSRVEEIIDENERILRSLNKPNKQ